MSLPRQTLWSLRKLRGFVRYGRPLHIGSGTNQPTCSLSGCRAARCVMGPTESWFCSALVSKGFGACKRKNASPLAVSVGSCGRPFHWRRFHIPYGSQIRSPPGKESGFSWMGNRSLSVVFFFFIKSCYSSSSGAPAPVIKSMSLQRNS